MGFAGLAWGFPVDRPLAPQETKDHLPQTRRSPSEPWYSLSVIRMNSTYLECVDKFFGGKGFVSIAGLTITITILYVLYITYFYAIVRWPSHSESEKLEEVLLVAFLSVLFIPCLWLGSWFLRKESFRYTHWPMRFNRKNRTAYFFRLDGTVVSVPWDKLYFTLGSGAHDGWEVHCHRMSEDGQTVLDTFGLIGHGKRGDPAIYSQFEFIRRYMEEPAELPRLANQIEHVMEIADRRETFWNGFQRLLADFGSSPALAFLMSPILFLEAIARSFAMHTSKIPVWPEEVQRECQAEPNDPYLRDRDHLAAPGTEQPPVWK